MERVLAIRFDVDSVTCIERGIPPLRRLADRLGVRFTFFVNMGHSFNRTFQARHLLRRLRAAGRQRGRGTAQEHAERTGSGTYGSSAPRRTLPTTTKLGWRGVLETVLINPALGERYRATFDALHAEGHELGLHGGTDHVVWQRGLDELDEEGLERLFRPAYERFRARYGAPAGFASPGFRYDRSVLELLDREGFAYASDMSGDEPFRPRRADGAPYAHYQIPVNVAGAHNVPLIEQGLAEGRDEGHIEESVVAAIAGHDFALTYGHPYVEGVRAPLLGRILERSRETHNIVTMSEYLRRWRAARG